MATRKKAAKGLPVSAKTLPMVKRVVRDYLARHWLRIFFGFVLCVVGGYAPTQDLHDVWLMLLFGISGYLMRKLDYPMAPMVLAIVLGPLAESSLRQSLLLSEGSLMVFIERPISGPIVAVAMLLFLLPVFKAIKKKRAAGKEPEDGSQG